MRTVIAIAVLILLNFKTQAQKEEYFQGMFISKRGDTAKGMIAVVNKGAGFKFKSEQEGFKDIQLDSVSQVIVNNNRYTTWFGKRNVIWLDPIEHEVKNVDSFRTELIPLKLQHEGTKYSLYSYHDETERFFIGYDGKIEELLMYYQVLSEKHYRDNSLLFSRPRYTSFFVFRDQVVAILGGKVSNRQRNQIFNTDYNLQHMKRMIKRIDQK